MSFLNVHKRNALDKIPIDKRDIEPGDIVLFRYKGKKGMSEKIVLCLGGLAGKFATGDKLTAIDLDKFDRYYHHLFLWDNVQNELVGAYRMGLGKDIFKKYI